MSSPQKIRGQRSEVGGQKNRGQGSEVRGQRSEVRGQQPELETLIDKAFSRGVAAHGDLELYVQDFGAHVKSILTKRLGESPEPHAAIGFVASLHAEDLYLAAACAHNSPDAWNRLAALYDNHIGNVTHAVCSTHQEARELASNILAHLFFFDRSGQRRIASYDGLCALKTWVATIVRYQAANQRQLKSNEAMSLDSLRGTPSSKAESDLEAALLDARYGDALAGVFKTAAEQLTDRERLVLLLRFEDEISAGEVARMLGVHPARR